MIRTLQLLSIAALVGMVSVAQAEDKAATSELPAAIEAIGADAAVITQTDAHDVRGQALKQSKSFQVWGGTAVGTTNLLEGVMGAFKFVQVVPPPAENEDPSTLVIEGTMGGLEGRIGVNGKGGMSFNLQGKALQETLDFAGIFSQNFKQSYKVW